MPPPSKLASVVHGSAMRVSPKLERPERELRDDQDADGREQRHKDAHGTGHVAPP